MTIILTPGTDLAPLVGARVQISALMTARIEQIRHGGTARQPALHGGVWGLLTQEPDRDSRGGRSAFFLRYGTPLTPLTDTPARTGGAR